MTAQVKSKFNVWFEEQHGKRPSNKTIDALIKNRNSKLAEAATASKLVDDCALWDARQTSALWARQAALSKL